MGRHRRPQPPGALLVATLAVATVTSCGPIDATSSDVRGATAVDAEYHVSEYGVRVGIRVGFDEVRTVTGARLSTGDQSADVPLYALDGPDTDAPPESVRLAIGDEVLLEGTLMGSCSSAPGTPVFEVVSESDGATRTDRFTPADPNGYQNAVAEWCELPFTVNVTGSTITPGGGLEIHLDLINPGRDPVEVVSSRVDDGETSWEEASTVVQPGSRGEMTIRGQGAPGCGGTPPWESGHLRADGEVVEPASAEWC